MMEDLPAHNIDGAAKPLGHLAALNFTTTIRQQRIKVLGKDI